MRRAALRSVPALAVLAASLSSPFWLSPRPAEAAVIVIHGGRDAPPEPREERPVERHGYVWDRGHYEWRRHHYVWVRGHYVRERRGYDWEPGRWDRHEDHYDYHRGEWHPHR